MKGLVVFLLPSWGMLKICWYLFIHPHGEKHCESKVSCSRTKRNVPATARTQTAWSRGIYTNHEATVPQQKLKVWKRYYVLVAGMSVANMQLMWTGHKDKLHKSRNLGLGFQLIIYQYWCLKYQSNWQGIKQTISQSISQSVCQSITRFNESIHRLTLISYIVRIYTY